MRLRAPLTPKKFFHTAGELTNIQREEMKAGVFCVSKSMDTRCVLRNPGRPVARRPRGLVAPVRRTVNA